MALRAKSAAIPCWHVGCARGQRWIRSRVRRPSPNAPPLFPALPIQDGAGREGAPRIVAIGGGTGLPAVQASAHMHRRSRIRLIPSPPSSR